MITTCHLIYKPLSVFLRNITCSLASVFLYTCVCWCVHRSALCPHCKSYQSHMLLLSLGCLIVFLVHPTHGHSSGARTESCDFLTVTHTHLGSTVQGTPCGQDPCRSHQLLLIGNPVQVFTYDCGQTYQCELQVRCLCLHRCNSVS